MFTKWEFWNTTKLSVFESVFIPILTYGHESWLMTERILYQVQDAEMGFLWRVHSVTQERTKVRWRLEQETSLVPPCLNPRPSGSKCTILKKKLAARLVFSALGALCLQYLASLVTGYTPGVTLHDVCSCEIRRALNVEPLLWISVLRDHGYIGSAMCPECPTKNRWGTSCWLNPLESGPEAVKGQGGVTTSVTLLSPVLVWSQQNCL